MSERAAVTGIDPSLTGTGVCAPDGSMVTVRSATTEYELGARHARLVGIVQALEPHIEAADLVVIEAPSLAQGPQAGVIDRYGLWWMIVSMCFGYGVPVVDVPPTSLKKYATGKGNATKAMMRAAFNEHAGADNRDDNQVDAWWLRAAGHHMLGVPLVGGLPLVNTAALSRIMFNRGE